MNQVAFMLVAGGVFLVLLLQVALLFRKPRFETPVELGARLTLLEQGLQSVEQAATRTETGGQRIELQLRAFTEATAQAFESSRRTLDQQLDRTVEESRNGRKELAGAFGEFA